MYLIHSEPTFPNLLLFLVSSEISLKTKKIFNIEHEFCI